MLGYGRCYETADVIRAMEFDNVEVHGAVYDIKFGALYVRDNCARKSCGKGQSTSCFQDGLDIFNPFRTV